MNILENFTYGLVSGSFGYFGILVMSEILRVMTTHKSVTRGCYIKTNIFITKTANTVCTCFLHYQLKEWRVLPISQETPNQPSSHWQIDNSGLQVPWEPQFDGPQLHWEQPSILYVNTESYGTHVWQPRSSCGRGVPKHSRWAETHPKKFPSWRETLLNLVQILQPWV